MMGVFGENDPEELGDSEITLKGTISTSVIWGGTLGAGVGRPGLASGWAAEFSSQE